MRKEEGAQHSIPGVVLQCFDVHTLLCAATAWRAAPTAPLCQRAQPALELQHCTAGTNAVPLCTQPSPKPGSVGPTALPDGVGLNVVPHSHPERAVFRRVPLFLLHSENQEKSLGTEGVKSLHPLLSGPLCSARPSAHVLRCRSSGSGQCFRSLSTYAGHFRA